jgi:hypothetical protein
VQINRAGALPTLADRPYHQALATAHIAACKDIVLVGFIIGDIRSHIAARVQFYFGLID